MSLLIGLTYDLESDYPINPDSPADANSEFDSVRTIKALKKGIKESGHRLTDLGNFENLMRNRKNLKSKADLVFNIAEGVKGRNREAQVPVLLEYLNIPYTGSDALTMSMTLDKVMTKQILTANGIPTPGFFSYQNEKSVPGELRFPMIVKPQWEGSSMGITKEAVVNSKEKLLKRAGFILRKYRQPALIEEFITGAEYTVPIVGNSPPVPLTPMKVVLHGKDMGGNVFDNSYIRSKDIDYVPYSDNDKLIETLKNLAVRTYKAVNCLDFGRIDFRVNKKGEIFVLELNPLPALNPDDALALSALSSGYSYSQMTALIINAALLRYSPR